MFLSYCGNPPPRCVYIGLFLKCLRSRQGLVVFKAALEAAMTAAFLVEKPATSFEEKKQVAYELTLHAKCTMTNRAYMAETGAIPLLVSLLTSQDPKA